MENELRMQYPIHEAALIFPEMPDEAFQALKADIKTRGQLEAVWIYKGKIIDGRHRYRAVTELGRPVKAQSWMGSERDLIPFIISMNLHRRHLDESQRAMVAARISNMPRGANQHVGNSTSMSQGKAAGMMKVSRETVIAAKKVIDHGAPELAQAVEAGRVSVARASALSTLPKEEQAEIVAKGEAEILKKAREIRAQRTEKRRAVRIASLRDIARGNRPLTGIGKFPVIYADPPWRYEFCESEERAIENHYPTMTTDDICALPVANHACDESILFLWTTAPKLEEALRVMNAWGFRYRTNMTWHKTKLGLGYWARIEHEILLLGIKGKFPPPAPADRPRSVLVADREDHSSKPEQFYEVIEKMYPGLPKLELFAREDRDGWQAWGNQVAA